MILDCDDKLPGCKSWARYGYCLTSSHVRENCEHSCKAPQCATNGMEIGNLFET